MGKYFYLLFIFYFITTIEQSKAVNVECSFGNYSYSIVGSVYRCVVTNILNITTPEDAVIRNVTGTHSSGKTNDDVMAFDANRKAIEYFPSGLEKFFKNLKVIIMQYNKIKQIHQLDIKPFPSLVFLNVYESIIEILEDGLFDSHPNMQQVWFSANKVFHVGKNVFNNMNKITYLGFGSNPCISMYVQNNAAAVQIIIESLKTKCFDSTFANFSQNLANLETESKILTFETFPIWRENLENLENEFKTSRFSYLISIKNRFEVLNAITIDDFTTQNPVTTSTTEIAVTDPDDCMSSNFENLENNLSELFTESLNQTEHNLKTSLTESCIDVNYQTLNIMKDEFSKINEKLIEHSSEVRSELINNEVQHSTILSRIANLEEKLDQILNAINNGK